MEKNIHLYWYNEEGCGGNGPGLHVSEVIGIEQITIKSTANKTLTIDVLFIEKYSSQNYAQYFHHGASANMQYSFIEPAFLGCDKKLWPVYSACAASCEVPQVVRWGQECMISI